MQTGIGIPSPFPYMNKSPLSKFHSKAPVFGKLNKVRNYAQFIQLFLPCYH
jgi:hypothetical protein